MVRPVSLPPKIMTLSFAASLAASVVTVALGVCALRDVNQRCEELEGRYLEKRQIAVRGQAELGYATRLLESARTQGDPKRIAAFLDHMDAAERAVRRYERLGNIQSAERAPIAVLEQTLPASLAAAASLREGNVARPEASKALAELGERIARAFDALASFASDRATEYDDSIKARVANLSRLLFVIAALGLFAGFPAGLWVVHVSRRHSLFGEHASPESYALPQGSAVA